MAIVISGSISLFFFVFTRRKDSSKSINTKYEAKILSIKQPLADLNNRLKEITTIIKKLDKTKKDDIKKLKDEEKELKANKKLIAKDEKSQLNSIKQKMNIEIKELIRDEFDYEIPIADIKQAGISTTGKETHNELIELLKVYQEYAKEKKLWN